MTRFEGLRTTVEGGVGRLVVDRPAKRNAMSLAMWRALPDALAALVADPAVLVVVVAGEGEHFCAGADIGDLLRGPDPQDPMQLVREADLAAQRALLACPKPTVAAVRGSCIGGGLELAISCDLRVAEETARLGITPARLGVAYAPTGIRTLLELVGPGAARRLLFTAGIVDAVEAHRIGLVDVMAGPGDLEDALGELVDELGSRSQLTIAAAKESIRLILDGADPEPAAQARYRETIASGELAEGVAAFAERRAPVFRWRR
ncbi:enoyl-CoA hydratase/isomerase family protein [Arsenicicoccus sp. oral taxon 190]|uniref:enoyl-CoA hydratase/isomerase family protein n=1 Tax=Arsenicicoccus sp. oral taxon 190 TaxID=1658671 RepID=UPI00067A12BA|nr:enoyl-CoA hydratase-related protein [Arsenicicoccus sp. oral taxon 190]AKT50496.1 enoyl-CoA hydratase [Arsenicicoccus sp. oral taxon 190]